MEDLYSRATALGLDFDPGFDDDCLAERVALGACEAGTLSNGNPCAGCRNCAALHPHLAAIYAAAPDYYGAVAVAYVAASSRGASDPMDVAFGVTPCPLVLNDTLESRGERMLVRELAKLV